MNSKHLKIYPASRGDVEQGVRIREPYLLISVRDVGAPMPRLPYHGLRRETLSLAFDDAEPTASFQLPVSVRPMTREHAGSIWSFVLRHAGEVETIVAHCEQGMSRSPAIAAGLLIGIGQDADFILRNFQPNNYVLQLMLEANPRRENIT
jgi:predicted protein tyrosine phosphatase